MEFGWLFILFYYLECLCAVVFGYRALGWCLIILCFIIYFGWCLILLRCLGLGYLVVVRIYLVGILVFSVIIFY